MSVVTKVNKPSDKAGPHDVRIRAGPVELEGEWWVPVSERDLDVCRLNIEACGQLRCEREFAVVPRATHLFEEAGALEEVARLAAGWFRQYLKPR